MAKSTKKAGVGGTIVVVLIIAAFIVGLYMMLTRSKDEKTKLEPNVKVSEATTLIDRDLKKDYPGTAREVMKFYCKITQCLYNNELSDSEIEKLVDQLRGIYSDELLEKNERDMMVGLVRGEIKHYRSNDMTINSYNIAESGEIVYDRTSVPQKCAVDIYLTTKSGNEFYRSYETFYLYEDDDKHWKILGWEITEE